MFYIFFWNLYAFHLFTWDLWQHGVTVVLADILVTCLIHFRENFPYFTIMLVAVVFHYINFIIVNKLPSTSTLLRGFACHGVLKFIQLYLHLVEIIFLFHFVNSVNYIILLDSWNNPKLAMIDSILFISLYSICLYFG